MPERVQLRRSKGWRKPPGVVVVARPSKWGNPVPLRGSDRPTVVRQFREGLDARRAGTLPPGSPFAAYPSDEEIRAELRGRDLACWCPLEGPCHADVLLEIANG